MESHLARLLADYCPKNPDEITYRRRMVALIADLKAPTWRNSFDPGHFTASGWVLGPGGNSLLLIHHKKLNRWLQPGGHIEKGDRSAQEAAEREVYEETGVTPGTLRPLGDGLFDLDIHRIPARPDEPSHLHFDLRFTFQALDAQTVAGAEVREARWVPLGAWPEQPADPASRRVGVKLQQLAAALD